MNRDPKAFLLTRILRWGLAEVFCLLGNMLPVGLGLATWRWALTLNPHQEVAAGNRARVLFESNHPDAWEAFQTVLRQLANPADTSASDLYLSRTPGRIIRRLASRVLWGPSTATIDTLHDTGLQQTCTTLSRGFFHLFLARGELEAARKALESWRSMEGERADILWAEAELDWRSSTDHPATGIETAIPMIEAGAFVSPLDTLLWAERSLRSQRRDLCSHCLRLARLWIPEEPGVWRLDGALAAAEGDLERSRKSRARCLYLDPQDIETFLQARDLERAVRVDDGTLQLRAPASIPLGDHATVQIEWSGTDPHRWRLYPLPPAGWGLLPKTQELSLDSNGCCALEVEARRPDRVRGKDRAHRGTQRNAWPLLVVAIDDNHRYSVARSEISVVDDTPGQVLLTVTEDHEIHEERGLLDPQMLQMLLVEKSRFAADLGYPWTHMVEVGSTLATIDHAAEHGGPWPALRRAVRRHLAEETARGNDLQPHLHTFNDPAYTHFPYRVTDAGWRPHLRFLLTGAHHRGDWASVCPPPGDTSPRPGLDRLESVARAVAQVETVGRLGSPDFRPVLWRSGLLEYGDLPAERAWSAVALRRAGLLADSDQNKPGPPRAGAVPPAYFAGWNNPFERTPGGPLLQLPIVANLEGDYLMGPGLLDRRARSSVEAVSTAGRPNPGVHLFTVLTHDKFINARRGRQEFHLDANYGDWKTVRQHLEAWQQAGATLVTAKEGVEAAVSDLTWSPVPWLDQETYVVSLGATLEIRYQLRVLGQGFPDCSHTSQHLLIPVPCSLRPLVSGVTISEGSSIDYPDLEPGNQAFWWERTTEQPTTVVFHLTDSIGPRLLSFDKKPGSASWSTTFAAEEGFLAARVLLPWNLGLSAKDDCQVECSLASLKAQNLDDGLLLTGLQVPGNEEEDNEEKGKGTIEVLLRGRPTPPDQEVSS